MKFEDLKFMQIYGNCAYTFFMGEHRIKGPVDNVLVKTKKIIELLITNKYVDFIKNTKFKESPKKLFFEKDSPIAYETADIAITHNNPYNEKYIIDLTERCNNLQLFLTKLNCPNYYLIYAINMADLDIKTHKLKGTNLVTNIEYLKSIGLLEKTIFVGTRYIQGYNNIWDYWSDDLIKIIKQYNLKYIEIERIKAIKYMSIEYNETLYQQFIEKVTSCLLNGVDKKYLTFRQKVNKPTHKQKPKQKTKPVADKKIEKKSVYLYF